MFVHKLPSSVPIAKMWFGETSETGLTIEKKKHFKKKIRQGTEKIDLFQPNVVGKSKMFTSFKRLSLSHHLCKHRQNLTAPHGNGSLQNTSPLHGFCSPTEAAAGPGADGTEATRAARPTPSLLGEWYSWRVVGW